MGASRNTYLPAEPEKVAAVHDFLAEHESRYGQAVPDRYLLAGSSPGDQVEIPEQVYRILREVVDAMYHRMAITVAPQETMLTSQEAADMLGVSRPTLVRLLEDGLIPFRRVGTHRRVMLADLMDYRAEARERQLDTIAATGGDESPLDEVKEQTRRARRAVARMRREV